MKVAKATYEYYDVWEIYKMSFIIFIIQHVFVLINHKCEYLSIALYTAASMQCTWVRKLHKQKKSDKHEKYKRKIDYLHIRYCTAL